MLKQVQHDNGIGFCFFVHPERGYLIQDLRFRDLGFWFRIWFLSPPRRWGSLFFLPCLQLKNDFRDFSQARSLQIILLASSRMEKPGRKRFCSDLSIFHPPDRPDEIAGQRPDIAKNLQATSCDGEGAYCGFGIEAERRHAPWLQPLRWPEEKRQASWLSQQRYPPPSRRSTP